ITEELINADLPTTCNGEIVSAAMAVADALGANTRPMVSRAYHDTSFMARVAPVAMIFIPCRDGVSHRPDEYATPDAILLGVRVLAETLAQLSGATSVTPLRVD
ncbi:MAG TPA: M20/M25/M40 family metallo-hydrolase, partial [Acidobacteriaceae bacterium]|nr:M20/M25/M40 family metallo-hydrolase [Acidobacteriaceae bacterium]